MTQSKLKVSNEVKVENLVKPFFETGAIVAMVTTTAPDGWLALDGSEVSQTTYASIYALLSTNYNTGSETSGNFRLPNMNNALLISTASGASAWNNTSGHSHTAQGTMSAASTTVSAHNHVTNFSTNYSSFDHGHGYVDAGLGGGTDNNSVNANKTGSTTSGISGAGHYHAIGAVGNTGAVNESQSHAHNGASVASNSSSSTSHSHAGTATLSTTSSTDTFLPPGITAKFYIKV